MGTRLKRLCEVVLTSTHNLCFEKTIHGHVFVMILVKIKNLFNCIRWCRVRFYGVIEAMQKKFKDKCTIDQKSKVVLWCSLSVFYFDNL